MPPSPQEAERNRRRQRVQSRFAVVGSPVALVGVFARLVFDADWGMGVMSAGLFINTLGYAVTPLLHPEPLSELSLAEVVPPLDTGLRVPAVA